MAVNANISYNPNWLTVKPAGASGTGSTTISGQLTRNNHVQLTFSYAPHYGVVARTKKVNLSKFSPDSDSTNNGPYNVTQAKASNFSTVTEVTFSGQATGKTPTITGSGTAYSITFAYDHPESSGSSSYVEFKVQTNNTSNGTINPSYTGSAGTTFISPTSYTVYCWDMSNPSTEHTGQINSGTDLEHALPADGFYNNIYGYVLYKIGVYRNNNAGSYIGKVTIGNVTYTVTVNGVADSDIKITNIPTDSISSAGGTFTATLSANYNTSYTISITN